MLALLKLLTKMYELRAYKTQFTVCLCSACALVQVEKLF